MPDLETPYNPVRRVADSYGRHLLRTASRGVAVTDVVDATTIRTRADFGAGLTALREAAGFTVRDLARQIDCPAGTLGDYLRGRHVPSPAQQSVIVDALAACGVDDPAQVDAWLAALRRVRALSVRRQTGAPYRGLNSFEPEDAELFFGRREQTAEIVALVARLRADRGPSSGILAVIGPSGSGKSSLLRAGVVAAVRAGALDNPDRDERWTCAVTTPGDDPRAAVAAALPARGPGPHLVVLDQCEEIFTLTHDAAQRSAFLADLANAGPDVVIAVGLRADFFAEAAREPVLLAALRFAQVVVGPLTSEQLREVVVGPAKQRGVTVEDGLVELVLADLGPQRSGASGALPLLSHALLAAWDRSSGRQLTIADYRATGGLAAAVQRTAEEVFAALDSQQQEAAHDLFARLVNVDDDVAPTRRRIPRTELGLDVRDARHDAVRDIVDRFAERRLLTLTEHTVEVSHEALLTAWPRLHEWLDSDRAGLLVHRRLTTSANAWDAGGRDPAALPHGTALETIADWAAHARNRRRLNTLEAAYLDAALLRRDESRRAERRRTRRLTQLLVAVAVLAVVASTLAIVALTAQRSADRERRLAAASRDNALSRQVAIEARDLAASDPGLAQQLAVAGYRIAPTVAARSELIDAAAAPVITRVLGASGPTPLAVSSAGLVAVGHADDGTVHLLSMRGATLRPRGVAPGTKQQLFALAFSPDGRVLATGGAKDSVELWNVQDPDRPRLLSRLPTGFPDALQSLAFSPDGHRLLGAGDGPHPLDEWAVDDPARAIAVPAPGGLPGDTTVQAATFDRTGASIGAVTLAGDVFDWATDHPTAARRAPIAPAKRVRLDSVTFDPRTGQLLAGGAGTITIWNTRGSQLTVDRVLSDGTGGRVDVLAFSADGQQLLSGDSGASVEQWQTSTWNTIATTPAPGPVTGAAFSPDDSSVLTTAADGTLRRWSAAGPEARVDSGGVFALSYSGDGRLLAVARNGTAGGVQLWDTSAPRALRPVGPLLTMPGGRSAIDGTCALSRDGTLLAAANSSGQVVLWDTRDPARPRLLTGPFVAARALIESVAVSPDGSQLAVGGDDNAVSLWDLRDPSRPAREATVRARNLVLNLAFSGNGRLLAAGSADGTARLWDVRNPTAPRADAVLSGSSSYVWGVGFSPNGRLLAATSADRTTRLWSIADPRHPVREGAALRGPTDYAEIPSFDATGDLLAVPSNDHTVWVYDVSRPAHARVLATLRRIQGNVFASAFSPVGRYLSAGGRDPSVPIFSIDPAADATLICAAAGDPITRAEWRQYVPDAPYDAPCR